MEEKKLADKTNPKSEEKCCALCGAKSDSRVLLSGEQKGKPVWVCVRCLPVLVHGDD